MQLKDIKRLVIIVAVIASSITYAQEKDAHKEIIERYMKELKLSLLQTTEFNETLRWFHQNSNSKRLSATSHNKLVKTRDLKLQSILTAEQFERYITLKKEIEPNATYKFQ